MLALAQWILKGRLQALVLVLVTLATSPWVSINALVGSAALALVWLRKGEKEGLFLWLWALLPTLCIAYVFHSYSALLLVTSVCFASTILRKTSNWRLTLIAISVSGLVISLCLEHFASASLQIYVSLYEQFITQLQQQMAENKELAEYLPKTVEIGYIAGLMGSMLVVGSFFSLLLARSWQAKLFNPGGFQTEFHAIRMARVDVVISLVITGILLKFAGAYLSWLWIPIFPLMVSGVALFHAVALSKKLAIQWYIIFYIVLILWNPLKLLMVLMACLDSVANIRKKISPSSTE